MDEREYVQKVIRKYKTRSPYELTSSMGVILHREELGGILGYYYKVFRIKHIVLNSDLEYMSPEEKYVLSHELGHSVVHPDANTPFLRANTYLSVDRMEIEANKFAMQLLISDDDIREYAIEQQYTIDMLARMWGYEKKLIELRLKEM
ncbi:ImmA/IrrE family metallo-endopeptidase [Hungatella hathewayi]|uniref:ImmA/IrrE family metallo-endopeptidase n=1 Tax=Hungatella hathewayi TaxID=154046 RepID=UPI0022E6AD6F|nr:ImmA/IrrE family metallo-endopeptidase [Hungatella hathewayi]